MDIEEVWSKLISQLKTNPHINASQIDAFFSRVQIQAASLGFVMFTSESEFIKNWLEVHYANEIKQALKDLYDVDFMVMFEVDSTQQQDAGQPLGEDGHTDSNNAAYGDQSSGEPSQTKDASATENEPEPMGRGPACRESGDSSVPPSDNERGETYRTNPLAPAPNDPQFVRRMPADLMTGGRAPENTKSDDSASEYDAYLQMLRRAHDEDARNNQNMHGDGFTMQGMGVRLHNGSAQQEGHWNNADLRKMPDGIDGSFVSTRNASQGSPISPSRSGQGQDMGVNRGNGKAFEQVARSVLGDHANPYANNAPSLTFDTFVIGNSNRMAYAMAQEVAERPGVTNLNPLFIYGRSGVGKTHLLCSIKNYINEQYPEMNVCYIDSMELVNLYSEASRERSVDKRSFKNFEAFFEAADVLLIDDIQGLQGKPGTLDAVFRIFNNMIAQNKQMVFAADRAPKNIDLDERYSSRFNQGAEIDIQPPDDETKRSIVVSYLRQCQEEEHFDIDLSDDVINYIVERSSFNVRELRSAVNKVVFAMRMNGGESLSAQKVKELISNHFITEGTRRVTVEAVQHAVESFYQISHADLVSKKRNKEIKHARQVAIYLIRDLIEGTTYKAIGKMFNRDHSTIMHSYDVVSKGLKDDRNLREEVEAIREKIRIEEA